MGVDLYLNPPLPDFEANWQDMGSAPKNRPVLLGSPKWKTVWLGHWVGDRPPGMRDDLWEQVGPHWSRIGFQDLDLRPMAWMPVPPPPRGL